MQRLLREFFIAALACATLAGAGGAQSPQKTVPLDASSSTQKGLSLADAGRCREALPILKRYASRAAEKQLKVKGGLAAVRCGLALDQVEDVVSVLLWLTHEFPADPDVLYVSTHTYSDLSTRFALQLGRMAPLSHQARELNAEALESQGRWDDAAAEYKQIMKQEPDLPGIHYRLGRVILSRPATATTAEDARTEFQAELQIDPKNAGAEYVLGELSRGSQQWEDAIEHFSRASKLDANFADAFLGLGFSLNSAHRYAEAIPPLETEVRLQPANPTGHYQLAISYHKIGREQDAAREMALFQQTSDKAKEMQGEVQHPQEPAHPQ